MVGGTFTSHNKTVPGVFIDVNTQALDTVQSVPRGILAIPLQLSWGPASSVITFNNGDNPMSNGLGYPISDAKMLLLKQAFKGSNQTPAPSKVLVWRLATTGDVAAATAATSGMTGTAIYTGVRGNDLTFQVTSDPNNMGKLIVTTYLSGTSVDVQSNLATIGNVQANSWANFTGTSGTALQTNASPIAFTGGLDGVVTSGAMAAFLVAIQTYCFDVLGYTATEANGLSITAISGNGTTATVTSATHGLTNGNTVTISGATVAGFNGTVTVTVISSTQFTYPCTATGSAAGTLVFAYVTSDALTTLIATNNSVITLYVTQWAANNGNYVQAVIPATLNAGLDITIGSTGAQSELVTEVYNGVIADGVTLSANQAVAWVAGATAGALYCQALTYAIYPGASDCNPRLTPTQIVTAEAIGLFSFQLVTQNSLTPTVQVIDDINTWVSALWTIPKNQTFMYNSFIRFEAQLNTDVQTLFSQYIIGKVRGSVQGQQLMKGFLLALLKNYQDQQVLKNVSASNIVSITSGTNSTAIGLAVQYSGVNEQVYITVNVQ